MIVNYNGVPLEVEHILSWTDRNVYSEDNSERLFRHVTFSVQFIISAVATVVPGLPGQASAPQIVAELKRRLLQPRQPLVVTMNGTDVLRSPAAVVKPNAPNGLGPNNKVATGFNFCDARYGPNPISCDVSSVFGLKTFAGVLTVETWLVDADLPRKEPPGPTPDWWSALISHRWEMSNEFGRDYLNTRVISGRAVFRGDLLYQLGPANNGLIQRNRASDYIPYLNHPLPANYDRVSVRTSVASDGLSLSYSIVDQEMPSIISEGSPIAEINGKWRAGVHLKDTQSLSERYMNISLAVRGRRNATRQDLINALLRAATTFDRGAGLAYRAFYKTDLEVDVVNKEASLSIGYSISGALGMVQFNLPRNNVDNRMLIAPGLEDGITKRFPEDLSGGLGTTLQKRQDGNLPLGGNVGLTFTFGEGVPNNGFGFGGQQRLTTQTINDGQVVPSKTPSTILASGKDAVQTFVEPSDATAAALARGEVGNPQEG